MYFKLSSKRVYTIRLSAVSHHARGVVSAVWASASVVASDEKSDRFWFHGNVSLLDDDWRLQKDKVDVFARFRDSP